MKGRFLTGERISEFKQHLISEEKSENTIAKYLRDVRAFAVFLEDCEITKELAIAYKQKLIDGGYAVKSVNSMLASINSLFSFFGWYDCKVKAIKQHRQIFCSEDEELTKAEYVRLLNAAKSLLKRIDFNYVFWLCLPYLLDTINCLWQITSSTTPAPPAALTV